MLAHAWRLSKASKASKARTLRSTCSCLPPTLAHAWRLRHICASVLVKQVKLVKRVHYGASADASPKARTRSARLRHILRVCTSKASTASKASRARTLRSTCSCSLNARTRSEPASYLRFCTSKASKASRARTLRSTCSCLLNARKRSAHGRLRVPVSLAFGAHAAQQRPTATRCPHPMQHLPLRWY
jgi:hypothetical protein